MTRLPVLDRDQAPAKSRELLDELAARGGQPGPMVRTVANAPAVLGAYVQLSRTMKRVHLDRRVTERISLAVQEWLGCEYCLAAHTAAARGLGLDDHDIELARMGTATDAKDAALVAFALSVLAAPSEITDDDVNDLRARGYRYEQIAEVVALVSLNVLTGAFNLVAGLHPAEVS